MYSEFFNYLLKNKLINCFDNTGVFCIIQSGNTESLNIAIFQSGVGNTVTRYNTTKTIKQISTNPKIAPKYLSVIFINGNFLTTPNVCARICIINRITINNTINETIR